VPADVLEAEKADFRKAALAEGKPENVVDRIVEGRLKKFYEDTCLLEQPYVRDDKIKVATLIQQAVGQLGENIVVRRFVRYELGENQAAD
jgi:elongation factor Ts